MIDDGVDVNATHFSTKSAPVHLSSIAGKRRVLKLLLQHDALIDMKDKDGRTALHHAVAWANVRTAMILARQEENVAPPCEPPAEDRDP